MIWKDSACFKQDQNRLKKCAKNITEGVNCYNENMKDIQADTWSCPSNSRKIYENNKMKNASKLRGIVASEESGIFMTRPSKRRKLVRKVLKLNRGNVHQEIFSKGCSVTWYFQMFPLGHPSSFLPHREMEISFKVSTGLLYPRYKKKVSS